uniref:TRF2/HOY1 PH-like domain-containing protein n=1 Tax=Oryza meridionalis TaxID=40149 RepID=A0A0E0CSG4_9ORYZ
MVQHQNVPRKRRAERSLPPAPAPAAIFNVEVCGGGAGDVPLHKRVKEEVQLQPPPPSLQDMHILDGSSPLGLRLRKSPSLLELIQMKLAMENTKKKDIKSRSLIASERVKASNFAADFLKIGTWECTSQYEGDLVAKCYFAKHKLVWEVLDAGLKRKIEIQWSDIIALKATCPENGIGTLDLVLARPPTFFKETDPQPRKHTLWQVASDFTGGQASINRRHILQCQSSLLSKNFEKLIQCDQRLNYLSLQPYMIDSPVFRPKTESSIFENPNKSKSYHGFSYLEDEHESHLSKYIDHVSPCDFPLMSKKDGMKDDIANQQQSFSRPINWGASDVDLQVDVSQELKSPHPNSLSQTRSLSIDDLLSHLDDCIVEQKPAGNNPSLPISEASSNELLEKITQQLLSDSQVTPASDEKRVMARVGSLLSLLQKDAVPANLPKFEPNDSGKIGVVEVGISSALDMGIANGTNPPGISRKDSYEELLSNLFNISEDFDG